jgi:hypothetical protein
MFAVKNLLLTPQAVSVTPVTIKGANAVGAGGSSVTIPSHSIGDTIVLFAFNAINTTAVTAPSASGTVPAWNFIDHPTGANSCASGTAYFVATATNTTSGTWGNTTAMVAVVLSGQGSTPLGGHAESGGTASGSTIAPAVTMTNTDGTSALLHFFGTVFSAATWSAAPSGYTQQAQAAGYVCCDSKNVTTSDGSVTQALSVGSSGYRGATVEIRAH